MNRLSINSFQRQHGSTVWARALLVQNLVSLLLIPRWKVYLPMVVKKWESAIHGINHYPMDLIVLSTGWLFIQWIALMNTEQGPAGLHYPAYEQHSPGLAIWAASSSSALGAGLCLNVLSTPKVQLLICAQSSLQIGHWLASGHFVTMYVYFPIFVLFFL